MQHLRLLCPAGLTDDLLACLADEKGVAHVVVLRGAAVAPAGDLVEADVAREAATVVLERVDALGGEVAITVEELAATKSDRADDAERDAPGYGSDAVVWEEVEARTSEESQLSWSYLALMVCAVTLAAIGVLIDSPVLVVGAMVIGPDFGPIAALTVATVQRRGPLAVRALVAIVGGFAAGIAAAFVLTLVARHTSGLPADYVSGHRPFTDFVSHPDGWALVTALVAGVAGVVSLTSAKSAALVGVAVSVTTVPAAADVGVGAAAGNWSQSGGALAQLGVNVVALLVAGVATLGVRRGARRRRRHATD